jgi:hypothetical protein
MTFATTTDEYEAWLRQRMPIDQSEVEEKRRRMREDEHAFLRGTFYRWAYLWRKHCERLDGAPEVLGVGDIHVENFGTWRDADGRLAWGVNDFDEACPLPYTADLVRLTTSAFLAESSRRHRKDAIRESDIAETVLTGYREGLERPEPFVAAERHAWLRELVAASFEVKDGNGRTRYDRFVEQMCSLPAAIRIPNEMVEILRDAFPKPTPTYAVGHRVAGLGSLGRPRFTAVAKDWFGGMIVREAKALAPSAWLWARGHQGATMIHYNRIIKAAIRSPDPTLQVRGSWVVRRLAPDVGKVELDDLPPNSGLELLRAMGKELALVHAPSGDTLRSILRDLDQRAPKWLEKAAVDMRERVHKDWEELTAAS